jgi:hypothetical protein
MMRIAAVIGNADTVLETSNDLRIRTVEDQFGVKPTCDAI